MESNEFFNFNLSKVVQSINNSFEVELSTSNANLNVTETIINYFQINLEFYDFKELTLSKYTNKDFKEIKIENITNKNPALSSQGINSNHQFRYTVKFISRVDCNTMFYPFYLNKSYEDLENLQLAEQIIFKDGIRNLNDFQIARKINFQSPAK